jgi:hypothetical protein
MFSDQSQHSDVHVSSGDRPAHQKTASVVDDESNGGNFPEDAVDSAPTSPDVTSVLDNNQRLQHGKTEMIATTGDASAVRDDCPSGPPSPVLPSAMVNGRSATSQLNTNGNNGHQLLSTRASAFSIASLMKDRVATSTVNGGGGCGDSSRKRRRHDDADPTDAVNSRRRRCSTGDDEDTSDGVVSDATTKNDTASWDAAAERRYCDDDNDVDEVANDERKSKWSGDDERCLER